MILVIRIVLHTTDLKVTIIYLILIVRRVRNVGAAMPASFSVPHLITNANHTIEGVGLEPENCKPLWDKVVRQKTGISRSWMAAAGFNH